MINIAYGLSRRDMGTAGGRSPGRWRRRDLARACAWTSVAWFSAWLWVWAAAWLAVVAAAAGDARAQGGVAEERAADAFPAPTREDLARAYIRFERIARASPPAGEAAARANRAFDRATMSFFGGGFNAAIRDIDELALRLREADAAAAPATASDRLVMSSRLEARPAVWLDSTDVVPVFAVVPMYNVKSDAAAAGVQAELELIDPAGAVHAVGRVRAAGRPDGTLETGPWEFALPPPAGGGPWPAGAYTLRLRSGSIVSERAWAIVNRPLESVRAANEAQAAELSAAAGANAELADAIEIFRGRNALLTDEPGSERSAQFLLNPAAFAKILEDELSAIRDGRSSYKLRVGDWWRSVEVGAGRAGGGGGGTQMPVRIYAPKAAAGGSPLPVVVALHGAGGDENMFIDGYGAGRITTLAEERGFLVLSPATAQAASPAGFDALIAAAGRMYAIDPSRIYVVGHSMGGGATAGLVSRRPRMIAAAAGIAGAGRLGAGRGARPEGGRDQPKLPPMLIVAAELDPIIPPSRLRMIARSAEQAGHRVELLELPGQGHTLVVGEALPGVIEWLWAHRGGEGEGRREPQGGAAEPGAADPGPGR